jgi:hypothetical protein
VQALAGNEEATFTVSASVPARAHLAVLDEPPGLLLSPDDVARGYKDVSARYRISSNAATGYLLTLTPRLGLTRRIEVQGLRTSVIVRHEPLAVHQRPDTRQHVIELGLRFILESSVQPGRYALPLVVAAVPL